MAVFRVERNKGYTVMSNHHLRNKELSLKAKGLLSQMLSLPEDWDYTLKGLSLINREKIDAIREAIKELERAGYIVRSRERDEKGRLRGADYVLAGKGSGTPPFCNGVCHAPGAYPATVTAWQTAGGQGKLHFPYAALRQLPLCELAGSEHLATQAIHFPQV